MIFYLIGNGFDLHHCLKTSYLHFKSFVAKNDSKLVEWLDDIFMQHGHSDEDINEWSKLEEYLSELYDIDYEELYDAAFQNSETDSDKADYWFDPRFNIGKIVDLLAENVKKLKLYFGEWIDSIDLSKAKEDEKLFLQKDAFYINFNYTHTLEKVYLINNSNVLHIHSEKNDYILGHNCKFEPYYENPKITLVEETWGPKIPVEDTDIRSIQVKQDLNECGNQIHRIFFKNSNKLIQTYKSWFEKLCEARVVFFMGLSLGKEDRIYLEWLSNKNLKWKKIFIYVLSKNEFNVKKEILKEYFPNVRIEFVFWPFYR